MFCPQAESESLAALLHPESGSAGMETKRMTTNIDMDI
jgi:hypothetical protein